MYHKTSGCTYLNLSIQSVEDVQIAEYRNESGEKYHKCELCADKINKFGRVYITNYGNKYHTDLNCAGIKRTIEMIRLSDVEERGVFKMLEGIRMIVLLVSLFLCAWIDWKTERVSVPLLLLGGMTAVLLHLFAQEESVFI